MFNLDQAILEWRRQMLAAGVKTPVPLEELESHLREEVEQQMGLGAGVQEAFETAVQRIGQPAVIQGEFAKAGRTRRARLQRLKTALLRFIGVRLPDPMCSQPARAKFWNSVVTKPVVFTHDFIGTEHVLLGLLESKTGVVPGILKSMGVDSKIVRLEIEKIVGNGPVQPARHSLPYTPRVKKALALAAIESSALNQTLVGTEHIFLGLLLEGGGVAALVLKTLGVNVHRVREQILTQLGRDQRGV